MSQENVEVGRRALDAFNRRDLHAFLAAMDPDVDFTPFAGELVGSFHGHEDVRRWWAELSRVFSALRYELIEARDLGDRALATLRAHGVSKGSHAPVDSTLWMVGEPRHQKFVWWHTYLSEAEALEAVGLKE